MYNLKNSITLKINFVLLLFTTLLFVPGSPYAKANNTNLLKNGGFEQGAFQAFPPNHFVAPEWRRWWLEGSTIPEYDDTNKPNVTNYPYEGTRAQIYFKWGTYHAGIYQTVEGLTPCTPYRMTMYTKTDTGGLFPEGPHLSHARIGLDPTGTELTPEDNQGDLTAMPPHTEWSTEQTRFWIWEELSVETEPIGEKLTAITYAAPEPAPRNGYFNTHWDAGALIPTTFPNNRLPLPEDESAAAMITNVNITESVGTVYITWETTSPASTQVLYEVSATSDITTGTAMSHTLFLPRIGNEKPLENYAFASPLDITPTTQHTVTLGTFESSQYVSVLLLSRLVNDGTCRTSAYGPESIRIP